MPEPLTRDESRRYRFMIATHKLMLIIPKVIARRNDYIFPIDIVGET